MQINSVRRNPLIPKYNEFPKRGEKKKAPFLYNKPSNNIKSAPCNHNHCNRNNPPNLFLNLPNQSRFGASANSRIRLS
jgi:hypothetical protein